MKALTYIRRGLVAMAEKKTVEAKEIHRLNKSHPDNIIREWQSIPFNELRLI